MARVVQHTAVNGDLAVSPVCWLDLILVFAQKVFCKVIKDYTIVPGNESNVFSFDSCFSSFVLPSVGEDLFVKIYFDSIVLQIIADKYQVLHDPICPDITMLLTGRKTPSLKLLLVLLSWSDRRSGKGGTAHCGEWWPGRIPSLLTGPHPGICTESFLQSHWGLYSSPRQWVECLQLWQLLHFLVFM